MNLGQFHTRISNALRKGTALDALIPLWVAESAQLIETSYTFSWMRRNAMLSVDLAAAQPGQITMPTGIKRFQWIKVLRGDPWQPGTTLSDPLVGVDPEQVRAIGVGWPSVFWLDGLDYIYLDAVPPVGTNEPLNLQLRYDVFTDWPGDDNATPSLLTRGQPLLAASTLLLAAQETRDPRLVDVYTARAQAALQALLLAEEELKTSHMNDLRMHYREPASKGAGVRNGAQAFLGPGIDWPG